MHKQLSSHSTLLFESHDVGGKKECELMMRQEEPGRKMGEVQEAKKEYDIEDSQVVSLLTTSST